MMEKIEVKDKMKEFNLSEKMYIGTPAECCSCNNEHIIEFIRRIKEKIDESYNDSNDMYIGNKMSMDYFKSSIKQIIDKLAGDKLI